MPDERWIRISREQRNAAEIVVSEGTWFPEYLEDDGVPVECFRDIVTAYDQADSEALERENVVLRRALQRVIETHDASACRNIAREVLAETRSDA